MLKKFICLCPIFLSVICLSQEIQVNRQNKTIAVTADESVTADAEVAVISIGYRNYGPTQEAAFQDNVRAAERITQVLLQAKIDAANIETEKLRLGYADIDEKWTEQVKKERRFEAQQSWRVTVSASQAQAVVDLAEQAGANEINDAEWNVADPVALQAKASGAALAKARSIAEQMAKGLGTKIGELVYASNRAPEVRFGFNSRNFAQAVSFSTASVGNQAPQPKLKLFPKKVKSEATVHAVFAIE